MPRRRVQASQVPRRLREDQVRHHLGVETLDPAVGLNRLGPLQPGHVVVDQAIARSVRRFDPPELGAVGADDIGHGRLVAGPEHRLDPIRHDHAVDQVQVAVGERGRRSQEGFRRRGAQGLRGGQTRRGAPRLASLPRRGASARSLAIEGNLQFPPQPRLDHRLVEEAPRLGRDHQPVHQNAARRLAEHGDVGRIAAEGRDVRLDPLQRRDDVHHAVVPRRFFRGPLRRQRRVIKEAQPAQPVVQRHHHDAAPRKVVALVERRRAGAVDQRPAVDPHHDRRARAGLLRRPDVQVQAILAHRRGTDAGIAIGRRLDADRAIGGGVAPARPRGRRLRRPPAQRPDRRRRIGNVPVRGDRVLHAARQHALAQARLGMLLRVHLARHQGQGGECAYESHAPCLANSSDTPTMMPPLSSVANLFASRALAEALGDVH